MEFRDLIYQKENRSATIVINRPEIRNAMDVETQRELLQALKNAERDSEIRVVVIRGQGEHFSAGGDAKYMLPIDVFPVRDLSKNMTILIQKIFNSEKVVITAVDGYAVGGGLGLVLASDLAIATKRARFSQIFIRMGLTPDSGTSYFLPRAVGLKKAKELAYTGRSLDAYEALSLGIVNKVVHHEKLDEEVKSITKSVVRGPTQAIMLTKRMLNRSWELDLSDMIELEIMATSMCFQTDDFKEGVNAFREKREPVFSGK